MNQAMKWVGKVNEIPDVCREGWAVWYKTDEPFWRQHANEDEARKTDQCQGQAWVFYNGKLVEVI